MSISKPSYTINANDPRLAHGTSRWLCDVEPVQKLFDDAAIEPYREKINVTHIDKLIPPALEKYLILRTIKKSHGSRARGLWVLLLPRQTCFSVAEIRLIKGQCYLDEANILMSHHCFARLMQRSSKTSDVRATVEFVKNHLIAILMQKNIDERLNNLNDGSEVAAISALGKLLLGVGGGHLLAKTWVDASQFHAADKDYIAGVKENEVRLRWRDNTP